MARRGLIGIGAVVALVAVVAVVMVRREGQADRLHTATGQRRPNVLVIMTDDQTLESLRIMDTVKKRLVAQGTTFSDYSVSFPNCCPSRATYLSGQYSHNTGVEDNVPPLGGSQAFDGSTSLAVALQDGGYYTAHVGKYLNGWGSDGDITPPPGWDHWFGLIDPTTYRYLGYEVSDDGTRVEYGHNESDYQTDVLGAEVVDVIEHQAPTDRPWFISFTPLAPHSEQLEGAAGEAGASVDGATGASTSGTAATDDGGGDGSDGDGEGDGQGDGEAATTTTTTAGSGDFRWAEPKPAPRHERALAAKFPRGASYGVVEDDKPEAIRSKPPLGEGLERLIDQGYQRELQSLLAVDEWVGSIMDTLESTGQLENTVVIFTSDNGFFHGEHRLAFQKYHLYEPAVRVPLVIRGGPFPVNKKVADPAANVDLAPTVYALAGVTPQVTVDGIDLAAVAEGRSPAPNRGLLLENKSKGGSVHAEAIRTDRYKLIEHETGELELYDLQKDPEELDNLADDPGAASLLANLRAKLDQLKDCAGDSCRSPVS